MSGVDSSAASLLLGLMVAGVVSGLLPIVNAEAILTIAVLGRQQWWLALAASITVGQVIAKVMIFAGSREGAARIERRGHRAWRPDRAGGGHARGRALARVSAHRMSQILATLQRPMAGTALVGMSALVGMPPLAATSVLAGTARMRASLFCSTCLVGRLIRFGLLAYPLAQLGQP